MFYICRMGEGGGYWVIGRKREGFRVLSNSKRWNVIIPDEMRRREGKSC